MAKRIKEEARNDELIVMNYFRNITAYSPLITHLNFVTRRIFGAGIFSGFYKNSVYEMLASRILAFKFARMQASEQRISNSKIQR